MASIHEPPHHEYLGDGVYVSWNGYAFELRTGRHDSDANLIVLSPYEMQALDNYRKNLAIILEKKPNGR